MASAIVTWITCALFTLNALAVFIFCVNTKNFRTCEDTEFCKRYRRSYRNDTDQQGSSPGHSFELLRDSVVDCGQGNIRGTLEQRRTRLTDTKADQQTAAKVVADSSLFHLSLTIGNDIIKVKTDDIPKAEDLHVPKRYKLPEGEVLQPMANASLSRLELETTKDSAAHIFWSENPKGFDYMIRLLYSPFSIEIYRDSVLIMSINANQQMVIQDAAELETKSLAVCLDVSFIGATCVYGIPEHAMQLPLKPSRGPVGFDGYADPYRLYNLDVFEYELDTPMSLYGSIPLMTSVSPDRAIGSLGCFWANPTETWVDIEYQQVPAETKSHWMSEGGSLEVYVFLGPTPSSCLDQYTKITGRPYFPPLFSLGYHQCRWNYKDQSDLLSVHFNFDQYDIPKDVLWLDIEHTDDKRYFTWNHSKFPDPIGMQNILSSHDTKLVTIVDPHIKYDSNYPIFSEALAKGFFVKDPANNVFDGHCWPGKSTWIDFTNPQARKWWSSKFSTDSYQGSTNNLYIWNDMNEPSVFNGPETTMPKDLIHYNDWRHGDLHNLYGFYMHMATCEALEARNQHRSFVLSRAFFAGSQRFGAVWTGDNKADWGHLKVSIPMILSIAISGLPFVGADAGGFFGNPEPELLLRWYQLAAFTPFFRAHAHIDTKRREPWLFGEPWTLLIRAAIQLRYQLLSYWYTLFYEASLSGNPMMRPLFFEHPNDPLTFAIDSQFYIGSHLMLAPVTCPHVDRMDVYFPGESVQRTRWYDYFTLKKVTCDALTHKSSVPVALDSIPLYVRAGSIIPIKKRCRRSSGLMHNDPLTLLVFLDTLGASEGALYLDDGVSFHAENQSFQYWRLSTIANSTSLTLSNRLMGGSSEYRHVKSTHPISPLSGKVEQVVLLGLNTSAKSIRIKDSDKYPAVSPQYTSYAEGGTFTTIIKLPLLPIDEHWEVVLLS